MHHLRCCGILQLSLRCTDAAPGAQPKVEGEDGSDWLVVDAGKVLRLVLSCGISALCNKAA